MIVAAMPAALVGHWLWMGDSDIDDGQAAMIVPGTFEGIPVNF
jgi:hypothetical protein